ncbi:SfnB family sulfur acquisition oxidoreductase [Acinetobacter larvae]|uniref:SfnB family sulfur acquisition oxidoreductase n=1 Tax=Acinetobacter larvae TaxID=1789224 RepID=A0A1B2LYA7_9GAMM|nr:SfnB family sulfur acquisition oxidoreductase [Acinetobacter larvae]AOA57942.1 SfnB family sulfur acquisition oxidoreductase [Acinetobacter larvae]
MTTSNTAPVANIIENDQQALNAAYQIADLALLERKQRDQNGILPFDIMRQWSLKGLGAIRIPKQYGGAFVSNQSLAKIFKIIAKADASVGQIPQNQFGLLSSIEQIASPEQKQKIYAGILAGKRLANGGPERYSPDVRSISTYLENIEGQYYLTGQKFYSTGASFADWLAIRALHPDGHVVLCIIDAKADGVSILNDWNGFGQRTTASGSVNLSRVAVAAEFIFDEKALGEVHQYRGAFSQLLQVAIDVGIAEAAYADTLAVIAKARPIADAKVEKASQEHYNLQEVGKLSVLLEAANLLLQDAARYLDELDGIDKVTEEQAKQASIIVALAKVYANDAALMISEKLLELGGSRSSLAEHNLDQHWRNARVHTLHDPIRWKLHAIGNYYLNGQQNARHAWI